MSKNDDSGKYWPYMILGFLAIGITLGYWTIKNTINMPVHESNEFMQKYQDADKGANEIMAAQDRFDKRYNIEIAGLQKSDFKPKFLKRKPHKYYKLEEKNNLLIKITDKSGNAISDANITLLVTRPQTESDDRYYKDIKFENGIYRVSEIEIKKPGRYILRVKASKGDAAKYLDTYCYKEKQEK
jgi:hypothetical protein